MLEFIHSDVVNDYDAFADLADQYLSDANNISEMFAYFTEN